ncbi:MAG: endo alpha-1,4 polygalactosaminidase [Actinomycetes bacterium]
MTRLPSLAALATFALVGVALAPPLATAAGPAPQAARVVARTITPGDTLHIQFAGTLDRSVPATVFEVDCEDTSAAVVADLHSRGKTVVGYISAGSWENYRDDASSFPARVKGKVMDGWPDERWLDIRRLAVLKPIMRTRMDMCASKGFDAIEFDNVEGYANDSGFPLTKADQRVYNTWLAAAAKAHGLQPGLKNALGLIPSLVDDFDWALNEQCVQYSECRAYQPFVDAGKAVFVLEYSVTVDHMCTVIQRIGLQAQKKHLSLDAWRRTC